MNSIFEYNDYREYLQDYYNDQKSKKKYFSYRYFSNQADINSSAFLLHVISGKRNLTKNTIPKIAKAIGHSKEELEYFENLVFFNQAKTISEKARYYSNLIGIRKPIDVETIESDRYEFYSVWYHSVIRELIAIYKFDGNFNKLSKILKPVITPKEAEASINLLLQLGFIEIDSKGFYHQKESAIMTAPKAVDSFIIKKFQMEMLSMALKSYNISSIRECISASTTFSISEETVDLFRNKTREFRRELQEIAKLDKNPERVFQYTFNLFPLTREITDNE